MATPADIVAQTAQQKGIDPYLALATAIQESKLNPQAVGDNGTSFGLFQLHQGGELGNLTADQAFDPQTNANVALSEFANMKASNPSLSGGAWAAASQRPANPTAYANSVQDIYGQLIAIHNQNSNLGYGDVVSQYLGQPASHAGGFGDTYGQNGQGLNPFSNVAEQMFGPNNIFNPDSQFAKGLQGFMTEIFLPGLWTRVFAGILGIAAIGFGVYFIIKSAEKAQEADS